MVRSGIPTQHIHPAWVGYGIPHPTRPLPWLVNGDWLSSDNDGLNNSICNSRSFVSQEQEARGERKNRCYECCRQGYHYLMKTKNPLTYQRERAGWDTIFDPCHLSIEKRILTPISYSFFCIIIARRNRGSLKVELAGWPSPPPVGWCLKRGGKGGGEV